MNSKKVLTIQHRQEVGPGGVLCLFGIVKEDAHALMVLLNHSKILDESSDSDLFAAQLKKLMDCMKYRPSLQKFIVMKSL